MADKQSLANSMDDRVKTEYIHWVSAFLLLSAIAMSIVVS